MKKIIGIDARMFGSEQGGLGRYVEQLILHLEKMPSDDAFVIFLRKNNWDRYRPNNPRFRKVLADIPWYGLAEQIKMPGIIRKEKVALMHFPHWNVPLIYNGPFVVTIHDLLLLHYPTREASTLGPISYFFKQLAYKKVLRHATKRSRHIITISEFSKNDIAATLQIPESKISVTYPAPLPFANQPQVQSPLLSQLGITKPYVLYVGVAYPHKNLDRLLTAWGEYQKQYGSQEQLVLVGKKNFFYDHLIKRFNSLFANKNVIFTDYISDTNLPYFYQNARLFVFPSLYEGFGIPPLEALSQGTPILAANSTCLPEILGETASYFDPTNTIQFTESLHQALQTKNNREITLASAKKTLARYSWEKLAEVTSRVYQNSVY